MGKVHPPLVPFDLSRATKISTSQTRQCFVALQLKK